MAIDYTAVIEKAYLKSDLPELEPGDSVKVKIKIKEGEKYRFQTYEGVVLRIRGEGLNKTVTVRRVFQGVSIERTFLLHSPLLAEIQIVRKGRVRRARLYYLRSRIGKAARIQSRQQ
jgi:large subunit ribosomal protein L19